jgi:hypothetical protein
MRELSQCNPMKCETCRFWTPPLNHNFTYGCCGRIDSGGRDRIPAYLVGDFAQESLHTLPHFFCCLWGYKLKNTTCALCEEELYFAADTANWRHVKTEKAACHDAKLNKKGDWSKWASPKQELREDGAERRGNNDM